MNDEKAFQAITARWTTARDLLTPDLKATAHEANQMAMAYVWGWQDAADAEHDTQQSIAFGRAYGTVVALHLLNKIGSRPNIGDAWKTWAEHGHIIDSLDRKALDLIEA